MVRISVVDAGRVDELASLWKQLLAHHQHEAGHLKALGDERDPDDSWNHRRAQYLAWLEDPSTTILSANLDAALVGYAVVRVTTGAGGWRWGDRTGVLETLVVDERARGEGIGKKLLDEVCNLLSCERVRVLKVGVMAGNERALKFYRDNGAVDHSVMVMVPVE